MVTPGFCLFVCLLAIASQRVAGVDCYDCNGPNSPDFINCVQQHPVTCSGHTKTCQIIRTPDNTQIQCVTNLHECSNAHHLPSCGTGAITQACHVCCDHDMACVQQAIADLLPPGTAATTAPTQIGTTGTQAPVTATTQAAVTATTGSNAPTQAPLTDTTQTAITSVPMRALRCVQCGDYDMRTPCTNAELLVDTVTLCADTTASRCMTDVFTDSSAQMTTYKRCVHDPPCEQLWYSQTSDKTECLNFDPTGSIADLTCHFCCVGNGCNVNIVPDYSTQWRP